MYYGMVYGTEMAHLKLITVRVIHIFLHHRSLICSSLNGIVRVCQINWGKTTICTSRSTFRTQIKLQSTCTEIKLDSQYIRLQGANIKIPMLSNRESNSRCHWKESTCLKGD